VLTRERDEGSERRGSGALYASLERLNARPEAASSQSVLARVTTINTHWSQKGIASSRSLPIPPRFFFITTGMGRVAWPCLRAGLLVFLRSCRGECRRQRSTLRDQAHGWAGWSRWRFAGGGQPCGKWIDSPVPFPFQPCLTRWSWGLNADIVLQFSVDCC
jgi:hypothetical protein